MDGTNNSPQNEDFKTELPTNTTNCCNDDAKTDKRNTGYCPHQSASLMSLEAAVANTTIKRINSTDGEPQFASNEYADGKNVDKNLLVNRSNNGEFSFTKSTRKKVKASEAQIQQSAATVLIADEVENGAGLAKIDSDVDNDKKRNEATWEEDNEKKPCSGSTSANAGAIAACDQRKLPPVNSNECNSTDGMKTGVNSRGYTCRGPIEKKNVPPPWLKNTTKPGAYAVMPTTANNDDSSNDLKLSTKTKAKITAAFGKDAFRESGPKYSLNNYNDDYNSDDSDYDSSQIDQSNSRHGNKLFTNRVAKVASGGGKFARHMSGPEYSSNNCKDSYNSNNSDYGSSQITVYKGNSNDNKKLSTTATAKLPSEDSANRVGSYDDCGDQQLLQAIYKTEQFRMEKSRTISSRQTQSGAFSVESKLPAGSLPASQYDSTLTMGSDDHIISSKELKQSAVMVPDAVAVTGIVNRTESSIRLNIINEAVQAEEVEPVNEFHNKLMNFAIWITLAIIVIGVIVGLSVGLTREVNYTHPTSPSPSLSPTETRRPVLESALDAGKLRCGIGFKGSGYQEASDGTLTGIEVEMCYAVAAALFNDTNRDRAELIIVEPAKRWEALANKFVDLLTIGTTHTMERDIYERNTKQGFKFTVPYYHIEMKFAGFPPYVKCADNGHVLFGDCKVTRICVVKETTYSNIVKDIIPDLQVKVVEDDVTLQQNLIDGTCNVIATGEEAIQGIGASLRQGGYNISYEPGNHTFSHEPIGIVTREDDRQWSDFVNYVVQSLFTAEANNITKATANLFPKTSAFGDEFIFMFINAISAVGNYGELFDRALGPFLKRTGRNMIDSNGNSGLIFSQPFGSGFYTGQSPQAGSTIQTIKTRGHLLCGIVARDGFAEFNISTNEWSGLDADYCRAISAAIFPPSPRSRKNDATATTVFVNHTGTGTNEEYVSLSNESIDILSGGSLTLINDVKEPSTGEGFTFSQPYFYDVKEAPPIALVTREVDSQWSDFAYFVVTMTFYAEENAINKDNVLSFDEPEIRIFGDEYISMFRDVISTVGNYGEIYERNVQRIHPRNGTRNELNQYPYGPQIYPFPFGLYG